MQPPTNITIPFFAYGLFKPGQLGFHRLKDLVEATRRQCTIPGILLLRDGLPIIDPNGSGDVYGDLVTFRPEAQTEAYKRIAEIEPDKHYRWDVAVSDGVRVNVLFGRSPHKGSVACEEAEWDGRNDPLFTSALEVISETLEQNSNFDWSLKSFFRLQMAYLLLWSSIERYMSLRYGLGENVMQKVSCVGSEPAFSDALKRVVTSSRKVFSAKGSEDFEILDPEKPKKSILYYYQIRSNITHRGKAAYQDHGKVKESLSQLSQIFRDVLAKGFQESA